MANKRNLEALEELFPHPCANQEPKRQKTGALAGVGLDSVGKVRLLCKGGAEEDPNAFPPCKEFMITPGRAALSESTKTKFFDDNDLILHRDGAVVYAHSGLWWETETVCLDAFNLRRFCAHANFEEVAGNESHSCSELIMSLPLYWSLSDCDKYWLFYDGDCPVRTIKIIVDYDGIEEAFTEKYKVMEDVAKEICADHNMLEHETHHTIKLDENNLKHCSEFENGNDLIYTGRSMPLQGLCLGKSGLAYPLFSPLLPFNTLSHHFFYRKRQRLHPSQVPP